MVQKWPPRKRMMTRSPWRSYKKKLKLELREQVQLATKEKRKLEAEMEALKQRKALNKGVGHLKDGPALKNLIATTLAEQLSQLLTPQPEGAKTTLESSLSTYPSSLLENLYIFQQQNETGVSLPGHPMWASSPQTNPAMSAELSPLSDPSLHSGIAEEKLAKSNGASLQVDDSFSSSAMGLKEECEDVTPFTFYFYEPNMVVAHSPTFSATPLKGSQRPQTSSSNSFYKEHSQDRV